MNTLKQTLDSEQVLSRAEFRKLVGISRTTEWRMNQKHLLPNKIIVGGKFLGYSAADYKCWLSVNSVKGGK